MERNVVQQTRSLAAKQWKKPIANSWLKVIASKADVKQDFAAIVIDGYSNQIRHTEQAAGQIFIELGQIVKLYGGRSEIDPEVLKESAKNIIDNFGFISVTEIREAYRQWANGETKVKGAEMYGGEFNAAQVGKIISAYCERRKRVLGTYLREKEGRREQEQRKEKKRIMQEDFEKEFPKMIERAREEITDWREIPAYWYQSAIDRDMISFEQGEAVQIFKEAQEIEKAERANDDEGKVMTLGDVFKQTEKDPLDRAKVIARKLTVFRKLIERK